MYIKASWLLILLLTTASPVTCNNVDTIIVPCLKIRDGDVKNTIHQVVKEEKKEKDKMYMVLSFISVNNDIFLLIGCEHLRALKYYLLLDEINSNPLAGCCTINKKYCFVFGEKTFDYFTSTGEVSVFATETPFLSLLLNRNFDYRKIAFDETVGIEILYHPHVYIFRYNKKKKKFIRILNNDFYILQTQ